jgi:hypothetical protein
MSALQFVDLQPCENSPCRIPAPRAARLNCGMTYITGHERSQTLLLAESLDDYVVPENPVRFIEVFASLDLAATGFAHVEAKPSWRPGPSPRADARRHGYQLAQLLAVQRAVSISALLPRCPICATAVWSGSAALCHQAHATVDTVILPATKCRLDYRLVSKRRPSVQSRVWCSAFCRQPLPSAPTSSQSQFQRQWTIEPCTGRPPLRLHLTFTSSCADAASDVLTDIRSWS